MIYKVEHRFVDPANFETCDQEVIVSIVGVEGGGDGLEIIDLLRLRMSGGENVKGLMPAAFSLLEGAMSLFLGYQRVGSGE